MLSIRVAIKRTDVPSRFRDRTSEAGNRTKSGDYKRTMRDVGHPWAHILSRPIWDWECRKLDSPSHGVSPGVVDVGNLRAVDFQ